MAWAELPTHPIWANGVRGSSSNQQWTLTTTNVTAGANARMITGQEGGQVYEEEQVSEIRVYPNPFSSAFEVVIPDPKKVKNIIVLDMNGKQVEVIEHDHIAEKQTIGSTLGAGVFIVTINGIEKTHSVKIIKK